MEYVEIKLLEMMGRKNIRTIKEMNELTGVSRTRLSRIINGQAEGIHFETLATICKVLDCKIDELIVLK